MTEHDDRESHEAKADDVERELDELEERHDRLGEEIADTGDDWGRKQSDESVPGAVGEPGEDEDED
jgi:hypothetical protein